MENKVYVNYVFYQYGQPDQFVHRYVYDSDNRIKEVLTSSDRYVWHKDARYSYYLHGPLALTELGHWRNQQLRYAYTLQGWIKSVNAAEPSNNAVGKNVMSYQLGYFKNDYKPIAPNSQNDVSLWTMAEETIGHRGMYNGNISWMETSITPFGKQAMLYKYDQLNRITKSRSLAFGNNAYAARSGYQKYDEDYSYDANGNILTLKRHDDKAVLSDDFNYSYYANSNKLLKHKTTGGTYEYDAIGNLVKDNNENLSIAWTPSGKVRSVVKPDTTIYFRYDAMGNRIAKIVSTDSKSDTTAYVRDASGNVMTVYKNRAAAEAPIYGSSRIGEYMGKEKEGYQTFNLRKYELSNHLGNVLAVISDKVNLYGHNNILDSARAAVMSASDYYSGGKIMRGRNFALNSYRYGYQGSEKDNEIRGDGNHFTTLYREGNTELLTWWSPDPTANEQPWQSPYSYMDGNPVLMNDPEGDYSKFGALWRSKLYGGSKVYQSGEEGGRKIWGYNTVSSGGEFTAHFGNDARSFWKNFRRPKNDEIANQASRATHEEQRSQMSPYERMVARGGDKIDPSYTIEGLVIPVFKGAGTLLKYGSLLFKETTLVAKGGSQGGLNLFKWGQSGSSATGWKAGDYMLHLPNKGTPALNWKANYGALRSEMNLGKPIFDSYRLPNGNLIPTGGFLNAERFILQSRGWAYDPVQGLWLPPIR